MTDAPRITDLELAAMESRARLVGSANCWDAGALWPKCDWKDFAAPLSFTPAKPTGDGVFYQVSGQDMTPLTGTQPPSTRPPLVDEQPRWKISGEVVPLFYDKDDGQWHIQGSA